MRRIALTAIKLVVTGGLIWWLLKNIDFQAAGARLANADWRWFIMVAVLAVAQVAVVVWRWQLVVRLQIGPVSLRQAFHNLMVGLFFNQVLPSGIGGDAVRVWLLTRGQRALLQKAVVAILIERGSGIFALVTIAVVMAPWLLARPLHAGLQDGGTVQTIFALLLAFLVGGYAFLLVVRAFPAWPMRWWLSLADTYGDVRRAMVGSRMAPAVLFLGMVGHGLLLLIIAASAEALGIPVGLISIVTLIPLAMILASLPVSIAGWGVREAGFAAVLSFVGVDPTDAALLGLCVGFVQLAQGLAGGLVWIAVRRPVRPETFPVNCKV